MWDFEDFFSMFLLQSKHFSEHKDKMSSYSLIFDCKELLFSFSIS